MRVTYTVLDAFADASELMRKGEAHIIPNSGITPDRAANYLFTEPVETFAVSIFARSDTTDIKDLEDLVGRKVAVVEHNVGEKLMKPRKDIHSMVHRGAVTALFDVLSGDEDALVFPRPVMLSLARKAGSSCGSPRTISKFSFPAGVREPLTSLAPASGVGGDEQR